MDPSFDQNKTEIISKINSNISPINRFFGEGYGKTGYLKLVQLREKTGDITIFLKKERSFQLLYQTLVEWRMNRRGARLKDLKDFKTTISHMIPQFKDLEQLYNTEPFRFDSVRPVLERIYNDMHVMKSKSKFVSNAKTLHFLFPRMLMPMDRSYTLKYFYGGTDGTAEKYLEIIKFTFTIMTDHPDLKKYLDPHWNTTIPKMIDNAIILVVKDRESPKK